MMLKPRKKITRKELKHDPLIDALYKARHWWQEHNRSVSRFGGTGLVVIVLAALIFNWRSNENDKAATLVGMALTEYSYGNYHSVIAQLAPAVEGFAGLKSFGPGLFILGRSELSVGDSVAAAEHFTRYLEEYSNDPLAATAAHTGLGVIAEGRGDWAVAAMHHTKAMKISTTPTLKTRSGLFAAHCLIAAGDFAGAITILNGFEALEELPFDQREEISALLARARIGMQIHDGA